jgi:molybdopterin converting factor small subunit
VPTVKIIVPANWRVVADNNLGVLACEVSTVGAALDWLTSAHPEFQPRVFSRPRQLASWVNVYLGEDEVRQLAGLDTPIPGPADLTIVPAFAGG